MPRVRVARIDLIYEEGSEKPWVLDIDGQVERLKHPTDVEKSLVDFVGIVTTLQGFPLSGWGIDLDKESERRPGFLRVLATSFWVGVRKVADARLKQV